jgi:hypothetical protein
MPSRKTSAAAAPTNVAPSGNRKAGRSSTPLNRGLRAKLGLISQKSKLAEAIRYALSRWEGLTHFIDDGRVELDNNTVERSIRPEKCIVRRFGRRRPTLGDHRLTDRDL